MTDGGGVDPGGINDDPEPESPPGGVAWRAVLYDGHSLGLARQAQTFFDLAIQPACARVAADLAALQRGPDDATIDRWDRLRETQLELHRSFALALGGMWERHFRRHLWHSAVILDPTSQALNKGIERATWEELMGAFRRVRAFALSDLPSYPALALLHDVSSAVRHGNGSATERLHRLRPELFAHEPVRSWFGYFTLGGEPAHSIHRLDISLDQLAAFADAIADYWRSIWAFQRGSKI